MILALAIVLAAVFAAAIWLAHRSPGWFISDGEEDAIDELEARRRTRPLANVDRKERDGTG